MAATPKKKQKSSDSTFLGAIESKQNALMTFAIAALVWLAFGNSTRNDFVNYDDGDYVYENPIVANGVTVRGLQWAFSHAHASNWHPVTTISHMLDVQIYGLQPWGHHLTNVLLHGLAAILLFFALRKLTFSFWPSALVAVLFAIHPLRVESVAWISERKDVLSGVFFMLTLSAYARYARENKHWKRKYGLVVLWFALGLMSKPTLVTLPFVLLLLDYWPLQRWGTPEASVEKSSVSSPWSTFRRLVVEKVPLFVMSAASCAVTILAQKEALERQLRLGLVERIGNAAISYVAYVGQMFYPVRLAALYPYTRANLIEIFLAMILLGAISLLFLRIRGQYRFLLVGWLWYLGMLVPMIGLVQVGLQSRADRYTYLPQIGLYIALAWGIAVLVARWRLNRPFVAVAGALCIIIIATISRTQAISWRDSETLWRHTIQNTTDNYIAYNDLGTLLLRQHQPQAAILQFQKAIQINPNFENAYVGAGSAFMLMGRIDQAIAYYTKALEIHPDSAEDWSNLASALHKQGKNDEALADYKKSAALKPNSADMQFNLGYAFASSKKWPDSITCYREAIRLRPNEVKFHNNLAVALINTGKSNEAVEELTQALQVDPNYAQAHYNLGCLLVSLGRKNEAEVQFAETLRLQPDYSDAREQLQRLATTPLNPGP